MQKETTMAMQTTASRSTPLAVEWVGGVDGCLKLIDQTRLPTEIVYLECRDVAVVWEAIKMLRVRGAPAIGIAAAMGVVLGVREAAPTGDIDAFFSRLHETTDYLRTSRPTAVNLFWALDRMERVAKENRDRPPSAIAERLLEEAEAIRTEDRDMCAAIGRFGAALLPDKGGVLTHCNAGALATADFGTALSVLFHAHDAGKHIHAFVDETRPLLQGSRLTAWELQQRGVPATLLCDNMAALVMRQGKVHAVVVGADRIAANGDAANKIGTYGVAVLAKAHGIPFYVAAPSSTFDLSLADGSGIPIEERDAKEITHGFGKQTAPDGVSVYNPAFDVTPAELIAALITEKGVLRAPFTASIAEALG
jgi:methylthioribose-1-phosphate isomerase